MHFLFRSLSSLSPSCCWWRWVRAAPAIGLALLLPVSARAVVILEAGEHELRPDQPGQRIELYLSNTGPAPVQIGGLDLAIQISDGGPEAGGAVDGPHLSFVDLADGTVFEGFAQMQFIDAGNLPQRQFWSLSISSLGIFPEIAPGARRLLASLEFNTSQLLEGEFSLNLARSEAGRTVLYDSFGLPLLESAVLDGSLTMIEVDADPGPVPMPEGTGESTWFCFGLASVILAIMRCWSPANTAS